ncbi:MAG TPA: PilZ domain-containing protein [Terracidiphilus sp.]|nr:PilZ domain-containing protein [Terracidiphilus sp.]
MESASQSRNDSPQYRRRRAYPRYTVDTTAILYMVDVGARMTGRLLNLSLGGCLIRTDDRFPTGAFRRIEAEFCLQGIPFRLPGVTQNVRDRRNVGIRFLDLSDRKREQLARLMREIAEESGSDVPSDRPEGMPG